MNSEVRMLLEHRQKKDGQEDVELSEVFQVSYLLKNFRQNVVENFGLLQKVFKIQKPRNHCKRSNNVDAEAVAQVRTCSFS